MSGIAVAGLAVGAYGANRQANAANAAAQAQQNAANLSLDEMRRQFDISQNNQAPWLRAGQQALSQQQALMGLGGDTQAAMNALVNSPGYQNRLQQGQRGLDASLAARGGLGSGKALTAASDWNQNFASNEYGNRLNQLAGLSGTGQSTAANLGNQGMNYAQGMGNIWQNAANAQGAAGIAGTNAWNSGITGGLGLGLNAYNYLNRPQTQSSVNPTSNVDYNWSPNYTLGR